jgi:hypothetical protein
MLSAGKTAGKRRSVPADWKDHATKVNALSRYNVIGREEKTRITNIDTVDRLGENQSPWEV